MLLELEDLPLLQLTLTTQEILDQCRPWLDFQQWMLLRRSSLGLPMSEAARTSRLPAVLIACKRRVTEWVPLGIRERDLAYVRALADLVAGQASLEVNDEVAHMREGLSRRPPLEFDDRAWVRLAELAVGALTPSTAGVQMLADRERSVLMVLDAWLQV